MTTGLTVTINGQSEPTTPCHEDGRARTTVHERRQQEAEEMAA